MTVIIIIRLLLGLTKVQRKILLLLLVFFSTFFVKYTSANGAAALEILVQNIENIRQKYNVPAVGLTIVRHGEVEWVGSLGFANIETQKTADENTFYRLGSITKTFTSLALLKLQENGKLNITSPLRDYLSSDYYQSSWEEESPVTIENLLEHTAGLTDIGTAEFAHDDPSPIALSEGLLFNGDHHLVQWQPGLHSSYSNLGAGLAGGTIENVSGLSYDDYLSVNVLAPLNMHNSSTLLTSYLRNNLATGYDDSGSYPNKYWHLLLRPFGALNCSPKEMGFFLKMLVNRGQIDGSSFLAKSSIHRMETSKTTLSAKAGLEFGYGLGNYTTEHAGFIFHGHGGTAAGYLARYDYLIENRSGYAVMINSNNSRALSEIYNEIRNYLISPLTLPIAAPDKPLTEDISSYLGYYQPITSRTRVGKFLSRFIGIKRLKRQNENIVLSSIFGDPITLIHKGNSLYRQEGNHNANTAIMKTASGEVILQNDSNYRKISPTSLYTQLFFLLLTFILIIYSLLSFIWMAIKLIYYLKIPNSEQWLSLLRILPFLFAIGLLVIMILLTPTQDSISAILFSTLGVGILITSAINLILALRQYVTQINKSKAVTLNILVALTALIMAMYLYYWNLLGQPIWS